MDKGHQQWNSYITNSQSTFPGGNNAQLSMNKPAYNVPYQCPGNLMFQPELIQQYPNYDQVIFSFIFFIDMSLTLLYLLYLLNCNRFCNMIKCIGVDLLLEFSSIVKFDEDFLYPTFLTFI